MQDQIVEDTSTLPEGWHYERLGNLCRIVGGSTPKTGNDEFWNGDIVWITPTDLGKLKRTIIETSHRKITNEGYNNCGAEMIPKDSVVMSSRAPIGHLGVAGVPLCTNQGCKSFIPSDKIDSRFLLYSLRISVPQFQELGSGSTFLEISKGSLAAFEIPIPPTTEDQRRIASLLDKQLKAVEQARLAVEVQLAAANRLPMAYLRSVFENENTDKGARRKLGELLHLRNQVVHPRNDPKGEATFVGLEHIQSNTGKRIGSVLLRKENLTGRKPEFFKGDLVYGYLRPYLNKLWKAEFDGLCSVDQYVYSVDETKADSDYLAYFMRSPVYLSRAPIDATPGQLPRIRTEEVMSVEIDLPEIEEQKKTASVLNTLTQKADDLRTNLTEQLEAIKNLPAALLRRAFSGEI